MTGDDAALGAEVLLDADLSGIESHGIAHLAWHPGYVPGFRRGVINPTATVRVLRDSPVAATWDGDGGFGVLNAAKAMDAAIAKAEATGIGMVALTNGRHFGAAGYYARMAAERDMIGMAMCNVPPLAVASGSLDRAFGTNPIAFGAPVEGSHPFLLDDPRRGLYLPPMVWHDIDRLEAGTVYLGLASAPFDEGDYIRDRDEYLAAVRAPSGPPALAQGA